MLWLKELSPEHPIDWSGDATMQEWAAEREMCRSPDTNTAQHDRKNAWAENEPPAFRELRAKHDDASASVGPFIFETRAVTDTVPGRPQAEPQAEDPVSP